MNWSAVVTKQHGVFAELASAVGATVIDGMLLPQVSLQQSFASVGRPAVGMGAKPRIQRFFEMHAVLVLGEVVEFLVADRAQLTSLFRSVNLVDHGSEEKRRNIDHTCRKNKYKTLVQFSFTGAPAKGLGKIVLCREAV